MRYDDRLSSLIHPGFSLVARSLEILSWFRDEQFVALWLHRDVGRDPSLLPV